MEASRVFIHFDLEKYELFLSCIADWNFKNPNWIPIGEL
jgi:hypothetical protein